ncbi:CLUMA_CG014948, isoform A [Clunio marinus]|uniref:CLUMA_CG014948, isoform A n=1 Tax=Clunio marinus TaxID=568069 RepID=A0A1J1IQB5_9DIPT|nr:CLUMA_CG014948, isoform A [Clunio marinus]
MTKDDKEFSFEIEMFRKLKDLWDKNLRHSNLFSAYEKKARKKKKKQHAKIPMKQQQEIRDAIINAMKKKCLQGRQEDGHKGRLKRRRVIEIKILLIAKWNVYGMEKHRRNVVFIMNVLKFHMTSSYNIVSSDSSEKFYFLEKSIKTTSVRVKSCLRSDISFVEGEYHYRHIRNVSNKQPV